MLELKAGVDFDSVGKQIDFQRSNLVVIRKKKGNIEHVEFQHQAKQCGNVIIHPFYPFNKKVHSHLQHRRQGKVKTQFPFDVELLISSFLRPCLFVPSGNLDPLSMLPFLTNGHESILPLSFLLVCDFLVHGFPWDPTGNFWNHKSEHCRFL